MPCVTGPLLNTLLTYLLITIYYRISLLSTTETCIAVSSTPTGGAMDKDGATTQIPAGHTPGSGKLTNPMVVANESTPRPVVGVYAKGKRGERRRKILPSMPLDPDAPFAWRATRGTGSRACGKATVSACSLLRFRLPPRHQAETSTEKEAELVQPSPTHTRVNGWEGARSGEEFFACDRQQRGDLRDRRPPRQHAMVVRGGAAAVPLAVSGRKKG